MKIDSYSVQMNAQYYNLQLESTKAEIVKDEQNFENTKSSDVSKIQEDFKKPDTNNELSIELSKAILQNLSSNTTIQDKIELSHTSVESQGLNFTASAKVMADGKEINISMDVTLSRSFVQTTTLDVDTINQMLKDPLVISLDGNMPSLSNNKFSFDIDSDGKKDQISLLKNGNGFLALDKNNNGIIDNGNELFGTKSGDGFADLSKYDDDKNGWIDANDKIFDKLRIWHKTDTKDELLALGEVGIGAIFLGNTKTPFSLKSSSNEFLGEIRKSGIVLFKDNKAGIISHIDMAVETKKELDNLQNIQKNNLLLDMSKIYKNDNKTLQINNEDNDLIIELQKRIKLLEAKLAHASDTEKMAIQTEISNLLSQMMAMLNAVK